GRRGPAPGRGTGTRGRALGHRSVGARSHGARGPVAEPAPGDPGRRRGARPPDPRRFRIASDPRSGPRPPMRRPALRGLAVSIALLSISAASAAGAPASITSVRRDVVVSTALPGRVVAVLADVRIAARVSGDVIVWGGDVS